METVCRLCLEKSGEVDIFSTEDLVQDIFCFTSIKVSVGDKLPTKLCALCLETIYSAKNLRTIALKNNSHLVYLFGDDDSGSDESITINEDTSNNSNDIPNTVKRTLFNNDNQDHNSKKQRKDNVNSSRQTNNERPISKKISVRKDIFDSSPIVSSSISSRTDDATTSQKKSPEKLAKDPLVEAEMECPICQKTFNTRKKLYLHQRNHNKTLYCPLDVCGKKFATKGDLEKHIRTHTGEKPYHCSICDRSFAQLGTLKVHRESIHGASSFIIECRPIK